MSIFDQLAEAKIAEAMRRGELDDLPGAGRPLELEDLSHVPLTCGSATRCFARKWARLGSNQRPLACEARASRDVGRPEAAWPSGVSRNGQRRLYAADCRGLRTIIGDSGRAPCFCPLSLSEASHRAHRRPPPRARCPGAIRPRCGREVNAGVDAGVRHPGREYLSGRRRRGGVSYSGRERETPRTCARTGTHWSRHADLASESRRAAIAAARRGAQ
jgi:DnaJ-like protein